MPTLPYVPEAYDYGPTSRIAEMMLRAAQQQAQARYANAENLGRGIANAGQAVGDVLQQRQASQQEAAKQAEMGRRDGEWVAYLESGQWRADPQGALVKAVRTWGPDEGRKQFEAINDAMKIGQGNKAEDEKRLRNIASRVMKMGDPAVARMWPVIAPLAKRVYPEIQLGEQYDPQMRPTLEAFADAEDVVQVDTVDDAGNPVTRFVPKQAGASYAKPPKDKQLQAVETAEGIRPFDPAAGSLGEVIGQKPPKVAAEPSFQAKEVLDDAGKPVMANFNARTGQYMNAQTGQPIQNPRPVPSAAETQDARKFKQAAPILASVSELSERINTGQGLMAKASGELAKAKAKANYDDDVAEYEALVLGFTPLVARALGHTGVLTEQDVQSVRVLFPKPGDSKSLRDRKVARITKIIGELESAGAPAPAGGGAPANNDPLGLRQ